MTKEQYKTELENCSFVKAALMLIVVMYHSILLWSGNWVEHPVIASPLLKCFSLWLNTFHISGFTLVSGYIFCYVLFERAGYKSYRLLIQKKAMRLLIPYAAVSLLWAVPIGMLLYDYSLADIAKKFILGTSPAQLWFLLMLFNVFLIVYPLSKRFYVSNVLTVVAAIIFYGIGVVGGRILPNVFQFFTALKYVSYFLVGFKIRQYKDKLDVKRVHIVLMLLTDIILFFCYLRIYSENGAIVSALKIVLEYALTVIGAVMAFYVLQYLADAVLDRLAWFNFFEKHSMAIYLLHQQFIYFSVFYLNGHISPYLHAIINFIVSVVLSSFISVILNKFRVTRILIGGK